MHRKRTMPVIAVLGATLMVSACSAPGTTTIARTGATSSPAPSSSGPSTSCGDAAQPGGPPPGGDGGPLLPPPATIVVRADTSTSTVVDPADSPQITCGATPLELRKDIVYSTVTTSDDTERQLKLDVQVPQNATGTLPLVVFITGGGFFAAPKESALNERTFVAEQGFVVASIEYRTLVDGIYHDAVEDAKAAIRYLRAHADEFGIDPARVAVWGESAGGYLSAMVGTTQGEKEFDTGENLDQSSDVTAVVDSYGLSDLTRVAADYDEATKAAHLTPTIPEAQFVNGKDSGKTILDDPEAAADANPITHVDGGEVPFLLLHGDNDTLVSPSQTLLLHTALREAGVSSTRFVLEGGEHGGEPWSTTLVMETITDFLTTTLTS